jgi:hypothetical protein
MWLPGLSMPESAVDLCWQNLFGFSGRFIVGATSLPLLLGHPQVSAFLIFPERENRQKLANNALLIH